MIRRIMTWLGLRGPEVDRAHRLYHFQRGKAVLVTELEQMWLEDDYEETFGCSPIFLYHRHPAVPKGSALVSLKTTVRTDWRKS